MANDPGQRPAAGQAADPLWHTPAVPQPQWPSPPVLASSLPWTAVPRVLTGHTDEVRSLAFSPDGSTLASADLAGKIRLWALSTGHAPQELTFRTAKSEVRNEATRPDAVNSVAFSPDGLSLATACHDGTVRLWDLSTGLPARDLPSPAGPVNSLAFSPGDSLLAAACSQQTVWLWDTYTGRAPQVLTGHTDSVASVAFSPDGSLLATSADRDGTIRLWDTYTGRAVANLKLTGHKGMVNAVAFSPDNSLLAGTVADGVWLWDSFTGQAARKLTGHDGSGSAVMFSPDGSLLATAGADKTVRLWEGATPATPGGQ